MKLLDPDDARGIHFSLLATRTIDLRGDFMISRGRNRNRGRRWKNERSFKKVDYVAPLRCNLWKIRYTREENKSTSFGVASYSPSVNKSAARRVLVRISARGPQADYNSRVSPRAFFRFIPLRNLINTKLIAERSVTCHFRHFGNESVFREGASIVVK